MKLIWQLLRQHVSVLQLAGFLVTNLVGVAIVLTAVQLYRDVTPALQAPDSFLDNDFIILTKEVEGAGIGKTSFTQTELAELAEQPFTEALGEFTPARYSVMGGISLAGIGMRTYLFFESVPDRFLDVRSDEWGFEEGSEFVPIILPRNYLNLYNFGFASTRGLPQVSEDLVRGITLDLDLSGRGQFRNLKGRVVAFSNRLNTILVPEEFIRWSNRRFADKPAADPSRIILEVRNAADDRIHEYLALHRYQIEGGAGDEGRASYFLRMATGVVVGVGLLITVLSFFIRSSFRRSSSAGRTVGSPINLRPILRGSFWRCGTLRTTGSMNTLRSTATRSKEVPATKAGRATFCAWRREWWSAWGC